jgi:hypothetical protein
VPAKHQGQMGHSGGWSHLLQLMVHLLLLLLLLLQ